MDKSQLRQHMHECLRSEVMMSNKPFSWAKTLHKAFKCPERRFNFWWRIACWRYHSGGYFSKLFARNLNRRLIHKYHTEIQLNAFIGPGLNITHYLSVVINGCAVIGNNFKIRQNCTIGINGSITTHDSRSQIKIGDNVELGAGSCIIGNDISIGNNVTIGAMTFINKNIPDNVVVYSEKMLKLKMKNSSSH